MAIVERDSCAVEPGTSLAGEPRDTVVFDGAVPAPGPSGRSSSAGASRGADAPWEMVTEV